ncbi:hypothetical protein BH11ACT8_BH11ACT8_01770 [soil metagenome]
MDLTRLSVPQRVSIGAMVVVAISAFLPWVSLFGYSVNGIEGDGVITLVLSLAGVAVLLATSGVIGATATTAGKVSQISLIVLAVLVTLVAIIDMNGAAAIGLYLTLFAGLAWTVGAVWALATSGVTATRTPTA